MDTGIDRAHPDFGPNGERILPGVRLVDPQAPSTDVQDTQGHGTHVSGTIAAATNNAIGVASVGWLEPQQR
jgi:subtilisin family serine protease